MLSIVVIRKATICRIFKILSRSSIIVVVVVRTSVVRSSRFGVVFGVWSVLPYLSGVVERARYERGHVGGGSGGRRRGVVGIGAVLVVLAEVGVDVGVVGGEGRVGPGPGGELEVGEVVRMGRHVVVGVAVVGVARWVVGVVGPHRFVFALWKMWHYEK